MQISTRGFNNLILFFGRHGMARYFSDRNSREVNIVIFQFAKKRYFLL